MRGWPSAGRTTAQEVRFYASHIGRPIARCAACASAATAAPAADASPQGHGCGTDAGPRAALRAGAQPNRSVMGRTAMKASTCSSVTAARASWCLATISCSTCIHRGSNCVSRPEGRHCAMSSVRSSRSAELVITGDQLLKRVLVQSSPQASNRMQCWTTTRSTVMGSL